MWKDEDKEWKDLGRNGIVDNSYTVTSTASHDDILFSFYLLRVWSRKYAQEVSLQYLELKYGISLPSDRTSCLPG